MKNWSSKALGQRTTLFDYSIIGDEDMDMELQAILKPYDKWDNDVDEETNLRAKEALHGFYKTLLNRTPATNYEKDNIAHFRYLHFFVEIRKAFEEEKYLRVCNELLSLMHYVPFYQKRVYNNTVKILETFLQIEENDYVKKLLEKDSG